MTAITFDTLKLAQRLRDDVKFPPEQAEKAASALADTFADWQASQQFATKHDLEAIKVDLIKWIVSMSLAQAGLILALLKLHA